jgi:hypothetical protein
MGKWKYRITIITWSVLFVSGISNSLYADAWIDGTPYFHEEGRLLAQTLGHNNRSTLAPSLNARPNSPAYKVGDERDFYAVNILNNVQYSLTASLRAVSDRAYVFVENNRSVTSSKIKALLASFDRIHEGIANSFGPPPDSIDGDSRIYLLIMDIAGGARGNGARVVGYFSPINQYSNAQLPVWINRRSNEVEMLYIDYRSLNAPGDIAESVVAHEFMHLVEWAYDPAESIWVSEGPAVYAEAMLGYEVESRISAFEKNPNTPLLDWSGSIEDYGAAYLFFAYLSERFGGTPAIAAIVKNREQDTEGIELALAGQGMDISFDNVFSDWVVANYLDDPEPNGGIYGYSTLDIHLKPSVVEFQYPIDRKKSSLKPWTAQYTEFKKGQNDALNLAVYDNGNDYIVAQVIEIGDDGINLSNLKSSDAESGTASITEETGKTILVITSQPNPPNRRMNYSSYNYSAEVQETIVSVDPTSNRITTWGKIKRD